MFLVTGIGNATGGPIIPFPGGNPGGGPIGFGGVAFAFAVASLEFPGSDDAFATDVATGGKSGFACGCGFGGGGGGMRVMSPSNVFV